MSSPPTMVANMVDKTKYTPKVMAAWMVSLEPRMVMICVRAMRSSLALKKGYLPLSRESRITPADQMSMAAGRQE